MTSNLEIRQTLVARIFFLEKSSNYQVDEKTNKDQTKDFWIQSVARRVLYWYSPNNIGRER